MKTTEIVNDRQTGETQAITRLYLEDDHCFEADASVVAIRENSIAFALKTKERSTSGSMSGSIKPHRQPCLPNPA